MKRQDWPALLDQHIRVARKDPAAFTEGHCAVFAAIWVWRCTQRNLLKEWQRFAHQHGSEEAALAALGGVEGVATRFLGRPLSPLMAQRGDIVSVETPEGPALGVCIGENIAALGGDGLLFLPLTAARSAWKVD